MSSVEARLRERCEALEDEVARLRRLLKTERAAWAPLRLSPQQEAVLDVLMRHERAARDLIHDALDAHRRKSEVRCERHPDVIISNIRCKLKTHRVAIVVQQKFGWSIPADSKARVRELCGVIS